MKQTPICEGIFLSFTSEQMDSVFEMLKEDGYSQDKEGLKDFILDMVSQEEPEPQSEPVNSFDSILKKGAEHFKNNPDHLELLKKMGPKIGTLAFRKLFKF